MENKCVTATLKSIKKTYYLFWLIIIAIVIVGEIGTDWNGIYADNGMFIYIAETVSILVTGISIPLALKLFGKKIKSIQPSDSIEYGSALYQKWFGFRLLILGVAAVVSLFTHYLAMSYTGSLCAILVGFAALFCIPSKNKLYFVLEPIVNKEIKE